MWRWKTCFFYYLVLHKRLSFLLLLRCLAQIFFNGWMWRTTDFFLRMWFWFRCSVLVWQQLDGMWLLLQYLMVMKAIWEVADFPHGPSPLAGIFATHFLSIGIGLSSKLNLENGKVCMYVQRCDWFDLHPLSRAQSWRLVTATHRKVMVHVEHFVSKHSHKVATATLIVMLPSIFVVVEDWFLCKFHRYLILIEGTVLNIMMFNRRLY